MKASARMAVLGAILVSAANNQAPAAQPQFEVATIRPNHSGARRVSIGSPSPGRFVAENVWLRMLIEMAWNVKDFQVSGGPGWASADRFDIEAKSSGSERFDQMRPMLQALLDDRFRLRLHEESREFPAFALVVNRDGAKLKESSEGSCGKAAADLPVCGAMTSSPRGVSGSGISMEQLAAALSTTMQRTVVDQTGLAGSYDIHLEWTADQSTPGFWAPGLAPAADAGTANDSDKGSIFTVIQEQLGLRLQPTKAPGKALVIDSAEKPPPM